MGDKWQNVSAGPRQVKDLQKALSALLSEGRTHTELYGVIGGKESSSAVMHMMGPVRAEVTALDVAIREKYGSQVTRDNVRAIIGDYQAAMPEARKSRPTEDNRRTPEDDAELLATRAASEAERQARQDAHAAVLAQVMAKAPHGTKALILAELHEDASDSMTDYWGTKTLRTVAIGFRSSSREDFRALRAAAAQFPETAHMASEETLKAWQEAKGRRASGELEHRDNYSMGAGNYLSDHGGAHSGTGWIIKSRTLPAQYLDLTEDGIPDAPAVPDTPAARPVGTSAGRSIGGDVLGILSRATADGNALRITERLSRADYLAVNEVLTAAGGKWNRKARAHLFPGDAAAVLAQLIDGGTYRTAADDGWFPTPPAIVARVLDAAGLEPGMDVLEPSAGEGAIAGPAAARGCAVDCIEYSEDRAAVIDQAGYARRVKVGDFLAIDPEPVYDRVLMNPPFAKYADVHHVWHALKFLRPGGRLVAIMAAGTEYRMDNLTAAFRHSLPEFAGTLTALPEQAFRESGTDVRTVIVTMTAPAIAPWVRLVADGSAYRVERHGCTLGRIRATEGKDPAGSAARIYWAITPAGDMTPHASQDEAAAHLIK